MTSEINNNLNLLEVENNLAKLERCEWVLEGTEEDLLEIKQNGVVAWKESDQGWGGLLCKNGKAYLWLPTNVELLQLPCRQRAEIRTNTLPGWQCIYCGLGHFLNMREEYYQKFREQTYGLRDNGYLHSIGFDVLYTILKETE